MSKANKAENFRCGECLHFKATCHRSKDQVCSKLGVRSFAEAPGCYTPDITKVCGNIDEFVAVVNFFTSKTPAQKRILLGMLRMRPTGKRLPMGTQVFINLRNRDYLQNYCSAFVAGYTSSGQLMLAGTPERNKRGQIFFAYLLDDQSVLTPKEWVKKYDSLVQRGRINDPTAVSLPPITEPEDGKPFEYEVPTIDKAPKVKGDKVKKTNARSTPVDMMIQF